MASEDMHSSAPHPQDPIPDAETSASIENAVPSESNSGPEIDVRIIASTAVFIQLISMIERHRQ